MRVGHNTQFGFSYLCTFNLRPSHVNMETNTMFQKDYK